MSQTVHVVVFELDDQKLAVQLSAVDRVVRAVEITHLPKAPLVIQGVINVQGQLVPVFNLRRRFQMPEREIELNDHILIVRTQHRTVALVADTVEGVMEYAETETIPPDAIMPGIEHVESVIKHPEGMIFIQDLEKFLSLEEAQQLEGALTS